MTTYQNNNFVDSLAGNFAVVRTNSPHDVIIEVLYIHAVEQVKSQYWIRHGYDYNYEQELELKADVSHYYINGSSARALHSVWFDTDRTEVITVSQDNIVTLLVDENKLIRSAARDWYEKEITSDMG